MKQYISQLGIFGHEPLFGSILPVGQINLPDEDRFREMFHGIFQRRYYTNHGMLAVELEDSLCRLFGTRNALVMTNATICLSLICKALGLPTGGKVIVPAFTFAATVQALTWAGLEPVFCDVDPASHCLTGDLVASLANGEGVCAILGVHLWGNACDVSGLQHVAAEYGLKIFFDAAHAIGCTLDGEPIGGFGACEAFSFHATKILNSAEGGCVSTNNDELAEKLRNLRSSYGRRERVETSIDGYGRFSEAQAALGLISLEDFPKNCESNRKKIKLYSEGLASVPGIRILSPTPREMHNYQYMVLEIEESTFGLSRDELVHVLKAENIHARRYFVPGMHRCVPYNKQFPQFVEALPITDSLCSKVMQLPSGQRVTEEHIGDICLLLRFIQEHAAAIKGIL